MALWGNLDSANNAPKYKGVLAGPKNYSAKLERKERDDWEQCANWPRK